MFRWYKEINTSERRTFWSCFGGWALDALDVQMFSIAIPSLIMVFGLDKAMAGSISSITLITSAFGGWIAGTLSDRYGRVRVLQWTIIWFSVFTFLCAFAQSAGQLIVLKGLQGLGFGGEWAAGAVLMAEMIRPEHRGKVMGTVQSAWAVGWGASVLLYTGLFHWLPPEIAWRVMFGIGLLPALFVIYVRRNVVESKPVHAGRPGAPGMMGGLLGIFSPSVLRLTLTGALLGVGAHGGYYALMTWLPTYLKMERKLSVLSTGGYLAVIIIAFWCGCIASAHLLDRIGRRRNIVLFSVSSALSGEAFYKVFSQELFPTMLRGTAQGFTFGVARTILGIWSFFVPMLAHAGIKQIAGLLTLFLFISGVVGYFFMPDTSGKSLEQIQAERN